MKATVLWALFSFLTGMLMQGAMIAHAMHELAHAFPGVCLLKPWIKWYECRCKNDSHPRDFTIMETEIWFYLMLLFIEGGTPPKGCPEFRTVSSLTGQYRSQILQTLKICQFF